MNQYRINRALWVFIALLIVGSTIALFAAFGAAITPLMPASVMVLPYIMDECNYTLSRSVDVVVGVKTFTLYSRDGAHYARNAARYYRLEVAAYIIEDYAEARECKRLRYESIQAAMLAEEVVS